VYCTDGADPLSLFLTGAARSTEQRFHSIPLSDQI
jgi:hypothetical protein